MQKIQAVKSLNIVDVQGNTITRPANVTPYSVGDALANDTTNDHYTFNDALKEGIRTGEVVGARMVISGTVATGPDIDLFLFHTDVGEDADNAANTLTNTELLTCIGVVNFSTGGWTTSATDQIQIVQSQSLPFRLPAARKIYGYPVMQNAYVPESGETFACTLVIRQD